MTGRVGQVHFSLASNLVSACGQKFGVYATLPLSSLTHELSETTCKGCMRTHTYKRAVKRREQERSTRRRHA